MLIIQFYSEFSETSRECRDVANKRRAMPPVTPHSFAKEMALNECFDRVWSQVLY